MTYRAAFLGGSVVFTRLICYLRNDEKVCLWNIPKIVRLIRG